MSRLLRYAPLALAVAGFSLIGLWFYWRVPLPSWMWGPELWNILTQSAPVVLPSPPSNELRQALFVRLVMQVLVSLICLTSSLYVILAKKYQPKDKHWAFATVGNRDWVFGLNPNPHCNKGAL
jgi:hypothetical protein